MFAICVAGYALVSSIMAGAIREVDGNWNNAGLSVLWPILVVGGAPICAAWCLSWLGRVPVRAIHRRAERKSLATAIVVRS